DDADLPEIDGEQRARAGFRVAPRALGAETDGQAAERAVAQQRSHVAGALDVERERALHVQAARIFADLVPDADGFVREVLIEHADAAGAAAADGGGEGAGRDDVVDAVTRVEQRGVAFETGGAERAQLRGRVLAHEAVFQMGDVHGCPFLPRLRGR